MPAIKVYKDYCQPTVEQYIPREKWTPAVGAYRRSLLESLAD